MIFITACGGGGGGSPPVAPGPPTIGQLTSSNQALSVAFSPPTSNGGSPITQYTATCRSGTAESRSASSSGSPIEVNNLTNGREYSCSVTARNSVGESTPSGSASGVPYTTPGAPVIESITAGDQFIEVAVSAPADDGGNAIIDYEFVCTLDETTQRVSGSRNVYPRTNGSRVVWEQSPVGGNSDGSVSLVSATGSSAPIVAATSVRRWILTPQVLTWLDMANRLQVENNGNLSTISSDRSSSLLAATQSRVYFSEGGQFFLFDTTQGVRRLIIEAPTPYVWAENGIVVFSLGGGQVYRLR